MKQVEGRWTELADAVAAGAPIDWDSLDAILTDDQDRRVLAQFKVLAIVGMYSKPPSDTGMPSGSAVYGKVTTPAGTSNPNIS